MKSRPCQWYGEGRESSRGDGCGAFGVCVAGVRTRICCRHAVVQRSAGCRTGWLGLESAVMKGSACSLSSAVSYEVLHSFKCSRRVARGSACGRVAGVVAAMFWSMFGDQRTSQSLFATASARAPAKRKVIDMGSTSRAEFRFVSQLRPRAIRHRNNVSAQSVGTIMANVRHITMSQPIDIQS